MKEKVPVRFQSCSRMLIPSFLHPRPPAPLTHTSWAPAASQTLAGAWGFHGVVLALGGRGVRNQIPLLKPPSTSSRLGPRRTDLEKRGPGHAPGI